MRETVLLYRVFESFEDNAAWEYQLPPACLTAQSRNLVPISLKNPVLPVFYSKVCLSKCIRMPIRANWIGCYKNWNAFQTIRVLCNANWMPRNLVLLSSLLRDVSSLSQNEWDYAMDTFVTKFDHIEPEEMPATVFQLLLISKGLNGSKIIAALINYYTRCLGNISLYTSNWEVCIPNFQT